MIGIIVHLVCYTAYSESCFCIECFDFIEYILCTAFVIAHISPLYKLFVQDNETKHSFQKVQRI